MTITTVYKTSDGEVFAHLPEAEEHDKAIKIWNKALEVFATYGYIQIESLSDFIDILNFIKAEGGL